MCLTADRIRVSFTQVASPLLWSSVVPHSYTDTEHAAAACSMQRCSVDMCGHGLRDAANTAAVSSLTEHDQQCDNALLQEGKNGS